MEKVELKWVEIDKGDDIKDELSEKFGFCIRERKRMINEKYPAVISVEYIKFKNIFEWPNPYNKDDIFFFAEYLKEDYEKVLNQLEFDIKPLNYGSNQLNNNFEVTKPSWNYSNLNCRSLAIERGKFDNNIKEELSKIENVRISYTDWNSQHDRLIVIFLRWEVEKLKEVAGLLRKAHGDNSGWECGNRYSNRYDLIVDTLTKKDLTDYL